MEKQQQSAEALKSLDTLAQFSIALAINLILQGGGNNRKWLAAQKSPYDSIGKTKN